MARRRPQWEDRWPPVSYWMRVTIGVLVVLALASLALAIGDILILILISLILAFGFQRPVVWMERRGVRRGAAVAIGLVGGLLLIGAFFALVLPDIIGQSTELVATAPAEFERWQQENEWLRDLNKDFDLEQKVASFGANLPGTVLGLLGGFAAFVFNSLTVLILTIYFTVNLPKLRSSLARLLRREHRDEYEEILDEATQRVGGYVIGNLIVSAIAGVLAFVALLVIGVPFAAALAFFVALMDLIPTLGALIAAAVCVLVALFTGVPEAVATGAYFLVYQQVENYLIQPRVMRSAVDMSPALVIIAILIGGSLLGVLGALLAIPIAAVIKILIQELYVEERIEEVKAGG